MAEAPIEQHDSDEIADRIIEMADRVRVADKIAPGAQATWAFEMDGVTYRVTVEVKHG